MPHALTLTSLSFLNPKGRDGIHRGRVEHERPRVGVPAVPGRHRRGGGAEVCVRVQREMDYDLGVILGIVGVV